ncbi:head-tail connector protein [Clostridium paraputrificum]|jgi:uncharacterized phage protein (predicted DNA packaging)|uniref:head-tail connector protein n=1 Tax=Clostridium paraputrificum TaxID=29363 RepID=UPI0018A022E6|nr:head-tail connector protein [Clostridium paraputrificum]MBS7130534.1 head-tail connector protein [Clostridium sp.]
MKVPNELIEEIKDYLNIYDEKDEVIENIILEAQIYIDTTVGEAYKNNEKKSRLAKVLLKKLCSDLYDNRSMNITSQVKRDTIAQTILDALSLESEGEYV